MQPEEDLGVRTTRVLVDDGPAGRTGGVFTAPRPLIHGILQAWFG